jgi:hypothetical protein
VQNCNLFPEKKNGRVKRRGWRKKSWENIIAKK